MYSLCLVFSLKIMSGICSCRVAVAFSCCLVFHGRNISQRILSVVDEHLDFQFLTPVDILVHIFWWT